MGDLKDLRYVDLREPVLRTVATLSVFGLANVSITGAGPDSVGVGDHALRSWEMDKLGAPVLVVLFIAAAGLPRGDLLFHLVATTTALSIVLHSSTDVPVVRWLECRSAAEA